MMQLRMKNGMNIVTKKYELGRFIIKVLKCYGDSVNNYLEKDFNNRYSTSDISNHDGGSKHNSSNSIEEVNNENEMYEIDHENILNELKTIQNQLDTVTITPEICIPMIKLLSKSLDMVNIERRVVTVTDEKWDVYCNKSIGRTMVNLIKSYGDRLDDYLQKNIKKQRFKSNGTLSVSTSIACETFRNSSPSDISTINNSKVEPIINQPSKTNLNNDEDINNSKVESVINQPIETKLNNDEDVVQEDASNSLNKLSNDNSRNNDASNRKESIPEKLTTINDTKANNKDESKCNTSSNEEELSNKTNVINENNEQHQNNDNIGIFNTSNIRFIGIYTCVMNYKSEENIYIDLEYGDTIFISKFSGLNAFGFNSRTKKFGLFPLYNIDSTNGFAVFYRVLIDTDADYSKNDAIFIISEAENGLFWGYNITKGVADLFDMDHLEVLLFDSNNNPILEDNPNQMVTTSDINMDINDDVKDNEYNEYTNALEELNMDESHEQAQSSSEKKIRHKKITSTNHEFIKETIKEIISKEEKFNMIMKCSVTILIDELEKCLNTKGEILNKVEIGILFKYFPELYNFSSKLLKNLNECLNKYDEIGVNSICQLFGNDTFDCTLFVKYSENYEFSLDAYERVKSDSAKFNKIKNILKQHKEKFHRLYFDDLLYVPFNHFVSYPLFLKAIREKVYEDDIYYNLEEEIEYLKDIGNQIDNKIQESNEIHSIFALKKNVMGLPDDFISFSKRKLIKELEIKGNVRGNILKHIYLFNDCIMVVSFSKKAKKNGYLYELEKIMNYKDYSFVKDELGNKICIKCVCKSNSVNNNDSSNSLSRNNNRLNGLFRTFKDDDDNKDDDKNMFLYFDNPKNYEVFLEECKIQKNLPWIIK